LQFFARLPDDKLVMTKAPEEGYVWEWRAFGTLDQTLVEKITAHPVRIDVNGVSLSNLSGQDLYLISPASDHNIKLRKAFGGDWILKFKLLLRTEAHAIEWYHESSKKSFRFPVGRAVLEEAAGLLRVRLPEPSAEATELKADAFVEMLQHSAPQVRKILIGKIRSQYQIGDAWVELADVTFPTRRTQSISLHAFDRATVEGLLGEYRPEDGLEVMNYVDACRRWA
jgi:hypothetical protein